MMECNNDPEEDRANDDVLISMVRENEILWNSHIQYYRDKVRKERAWEAVAKRMQLNVTDVKKDWIRLRTKWGREKRISTLCPGPTTGEEMISWPHFKSLSFLQTVVKSRMVPSRRRSKRWLMTTDSFVHTDVKPQLKQLVETESENNGVWTTSIGVVPFLDDMSVSQNCVVEVIQDNAQNERRQEEVVACASGKDESAGYPVVGEQNGFKLRRPGISVDTVVPVPVRSWHTPSPTEPEGSGVHKRKLEDALENSVTGLVTALKTFISQAATHQKKSENELFVQTLADTLDKMSIEKARSKRAKIIMVCLNEDVD